MALKTPEEIATELFPLGDSDPDTIFANRLRVVQAIEYDRAQNDQELVIRGRFQVICVGTGSNCGLPDSLVGEFDVREDAQRCSTEWNFRNNRHGFKYIVEDQGV